jgi:2-C-methyl-D-erythritol 2,4-cyclodiphosphate synthase
MSMTIGFGYDVHRLVPGRPLILGGVEIAYKLGLEGHSDADVLIHSVIDAILGALGKGDIGKLFPDTDPAYQGKSGKALLELMFARLDAGPFSMVNLDATIIAQQPRLAPYLTEMCKNLGNWLHSRPSKINIKAKTHERIGSLGRGEGIAAMAVVLIERDGDDNG